MKGTSLLTRCDLCGKTGRADDEFITHSFRGYAGYGSAYDGEFIQLQVCSQCLDQVLQRREASFDGGKPQNNK